MPTRAAIRFAVKASRGKVLVAMSGGVDSSVAAALLVRAGYEVVGCFMRLGTVGESLEADGCAAGGGGEEKVRSSEFKAHSGGIPLKIVHRGCCSISDAADARLVAAELGVPLYVCNFRADFGRVIDYFVDEYAAGRTPNPCIRCNDWLKFGKLHEYAEQLGCGWVASGHYARIRKEGSGAGPVLLRAIDHSKDQSYVLFGVPRTKLGRMMLPIGEHRKPEVRELARQFGLPVSEKPDSQEICFVPDDDYAGLVERQRPGLAAAGRIVDTQGRTCGSHRGQHRFTVGQRRGLGIATADRRYVVSKDAATNTVVIGDREQLLAAGCVAAQCNWLVEPGRMGGWTECLAKYRYNTPPAPARARCNGTLEVEFVTPQAAVAPGQAVVLYDAADPDLVLGGGWIERALPAA